MIRLDAYAAVLNLMYIDRMTVKRHASTTNADGTTGIALNPTAVYTNLPCRLSYGSGDAIYNTLDDKNPLYKPVTAFCAPSYTILKGDMVTVERLYDNNVRMVIFTGVANAPSKYETHQEFILVERGVG